MPEDEAPYDMTQCIRHGFALVQFDVMFAWAISLDEAVRIATLHRGAKIHNVQNWAEVQIS